MAEALTAALLPSSQRCEEVESLQSQLAQERELRAVMEGCLMEEKMAWRRVTGELVENHRLAQDMRAALAQLGACRSELLCRLSAPERSITAVQGGPTGSKGERGGVSCMSPLTFLRTRTLPPLLAVKQGLSGFSTDELKQKLDSSEEELGEPGEGELRRCHQRCLIFILGCFLQWGSCKLCFRV